MSRAKQHIAAVLVAAVAVVAVDAFTNRNPLASLDRLYATIAEDGLVGNENLVAPYAYRFAWVYAAKGVADVVLLANVFQPKRIQLPTVAESPLSSPSALKTSMA